MAEDIFKRIFVNGNVWISIKHLQAPSWQNDSIGSDNGSVPTGNKSLFETLMAYVANAFVRHSASMS